jgi:hypothetical protein
MERSETYYKKVGRRYIPIDKYNLDGISEGLWLVTKDKYSEAHSNVLYAVKTHDLQNVGRFADFYKAHKREIQEMVKEEYERFFSTPNKIFSISDLTDCIIAGLSKIK